MEMMNVIMMTSDVFLLCFVSSKNTGDIGALAFFIWILRACAQAEDKLKVAFKFLSILSLFML
jgi:hypothetical protein